MNDGGPAFPGYTQGKVTITSKRGKESYSAPVVHPGMAIRDYLAGQALAGMTVAGVGEDWASPVSLAIYAYEVADAMLAARGKEAGDE